MNAEYSDFLEKNPTFQHRVETFTSGLLTPDPKAVVLWSMEPGVSYTIGELHRQVKEFVGGPLPISYAAMWSYCKGTGKYQGVLERSGLVVNNKGGIETEQTSEPTSFAKTPVGKDFADAIAARALWLSRKLNSRYRSMLRIFGATNKGANTKTRRGFAVYKVIKLLAEHPKKTHRTTDIAECTGLSGILLAQALNTMGHAGVIDYESPYREKNGIKTTGWARYRLIDKELLKKDVEELYHEFRRERPKSYLKAYLQSVVDYIKDHPTAVYSADMFPHWGTDHSYISNMLSFLKRKGFLESDFQGGVIQSKARANKNTQLVWEDVLRPVEAVAGRLNPKDCKDFYEPLKFYMACPQTRTTHIQRMLRRYNAERNIRGLEGAEHIDLFLLSLPKKLMKLSTIVEQVNSARDFTLSPRTVCSHLAGLVRSGTFERPKKGYYRRK